MAWLTVEQFRTRTTMPQGDVDQVEVSEPGFIQAKLDAVQARIESQLRKRYAIPFADPAPEVAREWLVTIVTPQVYLKRGVNPSDQQISSLFAAAEKAYEEVKQAADCEAGLFDLPLRQDSSASGVSQGGPFSSSQASPYAWMTEQVTRGRRDDGA